MSWGRRASDAVVDYTEDEGDNGRDVPCVYAECLSSNTKVGPIWGHGDRSVKRALAELSGICKCGARFHNEVAGKVKKTKPKSDETKTQKPASSTPREDADTEDSFTAREMEAILALIAAVKLHVERGHTSKDCASGPCVCGRKELRDAWRTTQTAFGVEE